MVKEIITDKNLLRNKSSVSEINEKSFEIAKNLKDTLIATWKTPCKGFAIAAPQIGDFEKIIAVAENGNDENSITVMFNPEIMESSGKQFFWEKCLSGKLELSKVERPYSVKVSYFDENKNKKIIVREDIKAIVLCHEIDHLNGIICQDIATENIVSKSFEESEKLKAVLRETEPLKVIDKGRKL